MTDLEQLLVLQSHDTTVEQLRHRRETLAERDELVRQRERSAEIDTEKQRLNEQLHDLQRNQKRLEDEVAMLEAKAADTNKTLYSGSVTVPKELEALQSEVATMGSKQSEIEDSIIEMMESREDLTATLDTLESEQAQLAADRERVTILLAATEAEIDAEIEQELAGRAELAASLEPDLVDRYEKLRASQGGIAVARFVGGVCGACHLSLPAVEVARIKKTQPGDPVSCIECGTLLVPS